MLQNDLTIQWVFVLALYIYLIIYYTLRYKKNRNKINKVIEKTGGKLANNINCKPMTRWLWWFNEFCLEEDENGNLQYLLTNDGRNDLNNNATFSKSFMLFMSIALIPLMIFIFLKLLKWPEPFWDYNYWTLILMFCVSFIPFIIYFTGYFVYRANKNLLSNLCIIFNKSWFFYKWNKEEYLNNQYKNSDKFINFNLISAVQILCKTSGRSSIIYEMNLVLKDQSRINLMKMDNEYKQKLKKDANIIWEYLGVPVLDMSEIKQWTWF